MKKILFSLLIILTSTPASFAAEKESAYDRVMRTGVVRCGYIPWPPGFDVDPNTNEVKGPAKELFGAIIKLAGWKPEWVQVVLGNETLDLGNNRIDAMCSAGPWTLSNVRFVDYTTPATYTPIFLYARADDTRFSKNSDLNSNEYTFIGIDGDISTDLVQIRYPKAKMQNAPAITDPSQMLMDIATKKADIVLLDPVTAEKFMTNNPGKIRQVSNEALAVYPVGMSVRWGEYNLKEVLSRATEMAINIGLADDKIDLYDKTRKTIYSPASPYKEPK